MVDITISLTDEEKAMTDELVRDQNFKSIEDYFKFQVIDAIKLAKFNKELATERVKFEKPVEQIE